MRDLCMSVDAQSKSAEEIRKEAENRQKAETAAGIIFEAAQKQWQKAIAEGQKSTELVIQFVRNGQTWLSVVEEEKVQLSGIEYSSVLDEAVRKVFMQRGGALRVWNEIVFGRSQDHDFIEMHIHEMQKPQIKK